MGDNAFINEHFQVIPVGFESSTESKPSVWPFPVADAAAVETMAVQTTANEDQEACADEVAEEAVESIPLRQFLQDFGSNLFESVCRQNQPIYTGQTHPRREAAMDSLTRQLFPAQREVVRAVTELLISRNQPAAIINAEMGTGKTMMAIAASNVLHAEGLKRTLVVCPPHLVYKWRREILSTVPDARVWILNGADTLSKLLMFRSMRKKPKAPEYFILGRVRMRMGFNWKPVWRTETRYYWSLDEQGSKRAFKMLEHVCPRCGGLIRNGEDEPIYDAEKIKTYLSGARTRCQSRINGVICNEPLWTMCHKNADLADPVERTLNAIQRLPSVGPKTAQKLVKVFGHQMIGEILESNAQAFANLMDEEGEFIFSEAQCRRLERSLGKMEFSFSQGGYQASEFIKRFLPKNYFSLMVVDEAHEYKNYGTAQGQSMAVLARAVNKILALTGTLMGGYSSDIFYLLWRMNPNMMLADGFGYNKSNSLGSAGMAFARQYGVMKEVVKLARRDAVYEEGSFSSSKAKRATVSVSEAPGISPIAIMRYILPITVFLKLNQLGQDVLPPYTEHFREVNLAGEQEDVYQRMTMILRDALKAALSKRDNTLTSTVLNTLLAWPETCFREEYVIWKRHGEVLFNAPAVFADDSPTPKEQDLLDLVDEELSQGRRVLVYTVYSDRRDTTSRLKALFKARGVKAGVLRATVKADEREDWVADQLDKGMQVLVCNPELVKTGLDLLEFPTIYFMQTGYNVYTLMQAARRSWRIGQKEAVRVYFAGYRGSTQALCLKLMAQKIAVTQSTSGDMPDTGLDILNQSGDSIEVELARQLLEAA